jgi:hypothetical protein
MFGKLKVFITVMQSTPNGITVQKRATVTTIYCQREEAEERLEDWRTHNMRLAGQAHGEFHYMPDIL